jgi:hypothetical protein
VAIERSATTQAAALHTSFIALSSWERTVKLVKHTAYRVA